MHRTLPESIAHIDITGIFHQGRSNIVRTLEYVVGRVVGVYPSADPKTFRKDRTRSTHGNISNSSSVNIAHDTSYSQSSESLRALEYEMNQIPSSEPVGLSPPKQVVDQTTSKLEEIKLLLKNVFPGMDQDNLLNRIGFEIIRSKGNINLDGCLHILQGIQAISTPTSSKRSEKPPLSLHRNLGDLHQEAKNMLAQIEQLLSSNPDNHPSSIWEEIERLAKDYRITNDLNIIRVALDYHKSGGPVQH